MSTNRYSRTEIRINDIPVYGIEIITENGTVYTYSCISIFSDKVDELIIRMSSCDLSPVHFNDIISDYLTDVFTKVLAKNAL